MEVRTQNALKSLDVNGDKKVQARELQRLDTDGNGSLSANELVAGNITNAEDQQAIQSAYQRHVSSPNSVAFDMTVVGAETLKTFVDNNFQRLDSDGDGWISRQDLENVQQNNPFASREDREMVARLLLNIEELEEYSDDEWGDENDGITQADMAAFVEEAQASPDSREIDGITQPSNLNAGSLFSNRANPAASVRALSGDVAQGSIGDCYFLSAVAGVAHQNPQAIVDMIHDNQDGTYTVTFPGDSDNPVTIQAPTSEEMVQYASSGATGIWLSVLEKAYAEHSNQNAWISSENRYDAIDGGGLLSTGIQIMTGHSTDTDTIALTSTETTMSKIRTAIDNDRVVTASTFLGGDASRNIADSHVYTVTGYDFNSQPPTVTVRNPWGSSGEARNIALPDANPDGTYTLTVAEFESCFNFVGYEQED